MYVYENKVGWEKWCREHLNPEKIEKSDGSLVPTLETKSVYNYFQCYLNQDVTFATISPLGKQSVIIVSMTRITKNKGATFIFTL